MKLLKNHIKFGMQYCRWHWLNIAFYGLVSLLSLVTFFVRESWWVIPIVGVLLSLFYAFYEVSKIQKYVSINSGNFYTQLMVYITSVKLDRNFVDTMYADIFKTLYTVILPNTFFVKNDTQIGFYIKPIQSKSKEEKIHLFMALSFLTGVIHTIFGHDKKEMTFLFIPKLEDDYFYFDFKLLGDFSYVKNSKYWFIIPLIFGFKIRTFEEKFISNLPKKGSALLREGGQKIVWKTLDTGEIEVLYIQNEKIISKPLVFQDIEAFDARFGMQIAILNTEK